MGLGYGCGHGTQSQLSGWLPSHHALIQNERVLHEWMGLAWYLLSGRL